MKQCAAERIDLVLRIAPPHDWEYVTKLLEYNRDAPKGYWSIVVTDPPIILCWFLGNAENLQTEFLYPNQKSLKLSLLMIVFLKRHCKLH